MTRSTVVPKVFTIQLIYGTSNVQYIDLPVLLNILHTIIPNISAYIQTRNKGRFYFYISILHVCKRLENKLCITGKQAFSFLSLIDPLVSLMMVEKVPDSTYEMVGGLDKQIKEIKEVIELPVKHPELFDALGIAQPKGVLLYGPPGTGKTLLARAVAHHTECTFIRVSGSELVQKFIGEGSRMVRELFVMAREHAPSIIFMDEIDSIGSSRIESGSGGDSEVQRTMLELLNQLDGFEATKNIKVSSLSYLLVCK